MINVSIYLTVYSAYAITSCSSFLTGTINKVLHQVLFSFHSVSKPVLSESLATSYRINVLNAVVMEVGGGGGGGTSKYFFMYFCEFLCKVFQFSVDCFDFMNIHQNSIIKEL